MFSTTRFSIKVLVIVLTSWLAVPYLQSLRPRRHDLATKCTHEIPGPSVLDAADFVNTDRHDSRDIARKIEMLDNRYLPRLITNTHQGGSAYQSIPEGEDIKPDTSYTAGIVIGRLKDEVEQTQWVYDKLLGVKPYIYIVDDNTTSEPHLQWNHGKCDDPAKRAQLKVDRSRGCGLLYIHC